jgi:prophage antirepressor-like protein
MALQRFVFPMSADEDGAKFECWGLVMPDGGVACKLKELAEFLRYSDIKTAYKHVPDEWKITWKDLKCELWDNNPQLVAPPTTPANWHPETLFVLEPGVYALLARSNKPMAKERMKFVYETILPTIRKTGKFEMSKTSDVINYDARMAEMKVELLEEKMRHQSTVACLAEKERAIVEIKLEHERQLAEFKKREYEMKLAMQRLSEAANMTMTQFAVNALLAKDNIEENQQMRKTLVEVSDRVVPALSDRPHKEEYITGYERTVNGKRRIRMCRSHIVKNASEELAPSMPQRNPGDAYTAEQVVHAMHNCKNYFVEKMFNVNFNFYSAAPPPSVAPPPVEYSDKSKCN